jgi:hypothetical protein
MTRKYFVFTNMTRKSTNMTRKSVQISYRLTCYICIDLHVIFVQTYVLCLYRLTCHICTDLRVIRKFIQI